MAFGFIFLAVGIAVAWTTYAYALVSDKTVRVIQMCAITRVSLLGSHWHIPSLCWNVSRRWASLRKNVLLPPNESECHRGTDLKGSLT